MVLQSIRDRLTGIIAIFIFAILIIPFAFVGVSSYFTSDAVNAVAVVNDQEITINEFNQAFQNYRRRMQSQLGTNFDPEAFDQPIVRREFLERMIDEELLVQVSIDAGLAVSDASLARAIRDIEGFHVDGEFNTEVYQARLAAQGLTPQQFEQDMRSSLVLGQFPRVLGESAIATTWEVDDYVKLMEQKRNFEALIVPAFPAEEEASETEESAVEDAEVATEVEVVEEQAEPAPVAEEDILAWYEENKGRFQSEEQVIIQYIELEAAAMGGAIDPSEDDLRARFEEQQARFITPEARLASHILIEVDTEAPDVDIETARQQAEDLAQMAREGDFAAVASEHSQDIGSAPDGGDLGWIEPGFMVQAFEDALYALTLENPISEPVQTGFGWHVILLREIRPSEGMTYTEARTLLLQEYQAEADERRFLEQADRMVDIIYEDPTTLDAAADELGLEVIEAGPFGRAGTDFGVTANPEVIKAAFSDLVLGQGSVSDPIDLGENHIAMVLLKEHLPEAQLPLEEVREQVVAAVRLEQAMAVASTQANELLEQLEGGATMAEVEASSGLGKVSNEGITRISSSIDPALIRELFLMDEPLEGAPVFALVELSEAWAVVQLNSVTEGALMEDNPLHEQSYKRRVASATSNSEMTGFLSMLRKQSIIEVFEDRL